MNIHFVIRASKIQFFLFFFKLQAPRSHTAGASTWFHRHKWVKAEEGHTPPENQATVSQLDFLGRVIWYSFTCDVNRGNIGRIFLRTTEVRDYFCLH